MHPTFIPCPALPFGSAIVSFIFTQGCISQTSQKLGLRDLPWATVPYPLRGYTTKPFNIEIVRSNRVNYLFMNIKNAIEPALFRE